MATRVATLILSTHKLTAGRTPGSKPLSYQRPKILTPEYPRTYTVSTAPLPSLAKRTDYHR